jgi:4-diphosphocytidyl-2-C-methyl-D-erythritol kinase
VQAAIQAFAPAKVNLALHVTAQRRDGYHTVDSLVAFANVGDLLRVSRKRRSGAREMLDCVGPYAEQLPQTAENLVFKAVEYLAEACAGENLAPLSVVLDKRLPVASGIGGGSADAAAMLRAAGHLWGLTGSVDLESVARRIGADVAMCLHSRMARVTGIGDEIEIFSQESVFHAVLANPGIALETRAVFANLASRENPPIRGSGCEVTQIDRIVAMRNDLEPAAIALVPEIAELLDAIRSQPGCLLARMSGSGASCFGLFADSDLAERAKNGLDETLPAQAWCVATRLGSPDIALRNA